MMMLKTLGNTEIKIDTVSSLLSGYTGFKIP